MNNKNTSGMIIPSGTVLTFFETGNKVTKFKEKTTNEDLKDDFPYYLGFAAIAMGV